MENPHQKVKFRHNLNANEYLIVKDEKDEDQPKASLELRYALLKKQVARKPMMKKSTM